MKDMVLKIMKYVWAGLATVGGLVLAAAAVFLAKNGKGKETAEKMPGEKSDEEIDNEADEARMDASDRIAAVPARTLCGQYGAAEDAVADGRERFRRKAGRIRSGKDSGGMAADD